MSGWGFGVTLDNPSRFRRSGARYSTGGFHLIRKTACKLSTGLWLPVVGMLLGVSPTRAQSTAPAKPETAAKPDPAQVALSAVQTFYDQTRDVAADFFQTYVNKLYDRTDRSHGHVVFKKPGQMRWDYAKPNGKIIVASGGKLVVYEPGEEPGEKGQVLEQSFAEADLPQAMAFLLGTGRLVDDFNARLLDSAREGFAGGQVLELKAKKPSPHFDRILFYVENTPALRGLVRRMIIVDSSGNRNRFDFSSFKFNGGAPAAAFDYKPPADARRVHL
jgi:outer membrane lipoprotein carrier protein